MMIRVCQIMEEFAKNLIAIIRKKIQFQDFCLLCPKWKKLHIIIFWPHWQKSKLLIEKQKSSPIRLRPFYFTSNNIASNLLKNARYVEWKLTYNGENGTFEMCFYTCSLYKLANFSTVRKFFIIKPFVRSKSTNPIRSISIAWIIMSPNVSSCLHVSMKSRRTKARC